MATLIPTNFQKSQMTSLLNKKGLKSFLILSIILNSFFASYVQAAMISTPDVLISDGAQYSQHELTQALASDELKQQLQALGVDTEQLNDRVASLTHSEIQQLNAELADQPAGGIVGVLLTIFIVLIVTDMLCATDVFNFVKCINK